MRPLVGMVTALELCEGSSSTNGDVVGVEVGIHHQTAIIDEASIIDSCKKDRDNSYTFNGKVNANVMRQKYIRIINAYIDGWVQDCSNSSALAMELL